MVVVVVVLLMVVVVVTSDDDDDDDSVGAAFRPVVATIIGDASERPAHGLWFIFCGHPLHTAEQTLKRQPGSGNSPAKWLC